jgi:hypothetical protein
MGTTRAANIDANYRCILSQERAWARSVSRLAIKPRPISVWEVLIPVFLIFNFAKAKNDREIFVQNLLFTKELALKASLDMVKNNRKKRDVMSPIEERTRNLLTTVSPEIYSEDIRSKQLLEIGLLIDHFSKLMAVAGRDFKALVNGAYQSPDAYLDFLTRLGSHEKEVNMAALRTLGTRGDPALVFRMEETLDRLRRDGAREIFQTPVG